MLVKTTEKRRMASVTYQDVEETKNQKLPNRDNPADKISLS